MENKIEKFWLRINIKNMNESSGSIYFGDLITFRFKQFLVIKWTLVHYFFKRCALIMCRLT